MALTPEQRAQIARENGAKSRGPKTDAGKARSSRNALKTGEHADTLAHFLPPHPATICSEDRKAFASTLEEFVAIYKPANQEAMAVLRDMATARWQIERLHRQITIEWNVTLLAVASKPSSLAPELHDMHCLSLAAGVLYSSTGIVPKLNREIIRLQRSIAQNERRIKFINENFPDRAPEPIEESQPVESETLPDSNEPENQENEPPIYVTENVPLVIEAYRREFPGRKIIILPPEDLQNLNDEYDDIGPLPRRAA